MLNTITFAHSVSVIGGAERVTLAVIRSIQGQYRAKLLAPNDGQLQLAARQLEAEASALDTARYDLNRPLATAGMLMSAWRSLRGCTSILHTGDIVAFRGLAHLCRLLGIPTVCHMHYPYPESFLRWVFGRRVQPTMFVFCSQELQRSIGGVLTELCPASRQEVVHNGVDTTVFAPHGEVSRISGELPRVGIIANLQQRKGHDDFLRMAALLKQRGYSARYDVIGGDILQEPRRPELEALCREVGLAGELVFHGQIDDVVDAINALDVVVCASHEEAFPVSMLEAMACQKAIVSTDVNGIPEALSNGRNALLVKPHEPEALADAVARLLDDAALRARLASAARQSVLDHFSQRAFRDKMLSLYDGLLEAPPNG